MKFTSIRRALEYYFDLQINIRKVNDEIEKTQALFTNELSVIQSNMPAVKTVDEADIFKYMKLRQHLHRNQEELLTLTARMEETVNASIEIFEELDVHDLLITINKRRHRVTYHKETGSFSKMPIKPKKSIKDLRE